MKISKETVEILKNFARINPNLLIKKGSTLRTLAGEHVLAYAGVAEKFPVDVAIYDLGQFLGVLNLENDADVTFGPKSMTTDHLEYFYAEPKLIKPVPDKGLPLGLLAHTFVLSSSDILSFQRASAVLGAGCFSVVGDGKKATIVIGDPDKKSTNSYKHELGQCSNVFDYRMDMDSLLVIPDEYDVSLSKVTDSDGKDVGVIYFKNRNRDIQYWFAASPTSTI